MDTYGVECLATTSQRALDPTVVGTVRQGLDLGMRGVSREVVQRATQRAPARGLDRRCAIWSCTSCSEEGVTVVVRVVGGTCDTG